MLKNGSIGLWQKKETFYGRQGFKEFPDFVARKRQSICFFGLLVSIYIDL